MEDFIVSLVIFTTIYSIFSLGLNLQWGFTGLINFGHVAFLTLGSYTTVLLSLTGMPLILATLCGAVVSALLGLFIGFSTLRLRSDYLAIVTIGVAEVIRQFAVNEAWLTRGTFGIQNFPVPLATLNPTLPLRIAMIAVLTTVVGLAYWQAIKGLRHQLKATPTDWLFRSIVIAAGYLVSLGLLLVGVGWGASLLKHSDSLPAWALGLLLLGAVSAISWGYLQIAKRIAIRIPAWSRGLTVVSTLIAGILGVWVYGYATSALYHYSRNPTKTGLMLLSVVILAVLFWALERLVRSPWGRVLKAIREDEEVAKALGKNVFWYKLQALMLGGACAGIAGALYSWQLTTVYPDNFIPLITFNAWTIVVLGGAGNNVGTLLGACLFWGYDSLTRFVLPDIVPLQDAQLGAFRIMVIGLILMILMMWRPQGVLGKKEELTLGR